jgi:addiction module RelE/StbE family toxin
MPELVWDESFKRAYKKRISENAVLKKQFVKAIELFAINPYDPKLRTHKLSGQLKDLWAFSCAYDCRIVFDFIDSTTVLLIDIGSHDEVY